MFGIRFILTMYKFNFMFQYDIFQMLQLFQFFNTRLNEFSLFILTSYSIHKRMMGLFRRITTYASIFDIMILMTFDM